MQHFGHLEGIVPLNYKPFQPNAFEKPDKLFL